MKPVNLTDVALVVCVAGGFLNVRFSLGELDLKLSGEQL